MHVVITGANSYIGAALTHFLIEHPHLNGQLITRLTRTDLHLPALKAAPDWVYNLEGNLCCESLQAMLLSAPIDYVFHLASVTSKGAEANLKLSLDVNLHASLNLLEALRQSTTCPTFVFTSSIGVYGTPLPSHIDDQTPIQPTLTYGIHKRMVELLIADYTRLGYINGRTIRLSGVIARPLQAISALSTFSSDLLRHLEAGLPYTCPVSAEASHWLLSLPCCLKQLIHAATSPSALWPTSRAVTLPALRVHTTELVDTMAALYGSHCKNLVTWQPQAELEAQFARWPLLYTQQAEHIGFQHDHTVKNLIIRALTPTPFPLPA